MQKGDKKAERQRPRVREREREKKKREGMGGGRLINNEVHIYTQGEVRALQDSSHTAARECTQTAATQNQIPDHSQANRQRNI